MESFRPNLVLEGLPPFAEDRIASLRMGNVNLRLVQPCTRCVIPATDPDAASSARPHDGALRYSTE